MQSLGLVKCKNKNIKYYNEISKSEFINIGNLNINKISSTMVDVDVLNVEFIENTNSLRVLISAHVKIVYSKNEQNSLYVYEKKILSISHINIPRSIDGVDSKTAFIQKKFKPEIFVENIGSKISDNKLLFINFYMVINLKVSPSFCFAYCIDNNLFENIFVSFSDGKNLTQKTFTSNLNYSNILWDSKNSNLLFIGYENNNSYINILDSNSKDVSKVISKKIPGIFNDYCISNNNKILISVNEGSKDILYTYTPRTNDLKKVQTNPHSDSILKPYFSKTLNTLFCICSINNVNCFCTLDKNNSLDILFSFYNVCDYIVNDNVNKAVLDIVKDKKHLYYNLDLESKMLSPINFDFDFDKIIKTKYFKDQNNNEFLLILYEYEDRRHLCLYDFKNLSFKIVYEKHFINDFDIDEVSLEIFVVIKSKNFSQIFKLDSNKEEEIVKMPSIIKEICLK